MNNLAKRTVSGIGFLAIMLAALLTNQYVFGAVMLLALVIMMKEFLRMTCGTEYKFSQVLTIFAGATLFSLIFLYRAFNIPGRLVILAFVPVFILMINSLYVKDKTRFDKFSNLYASLLYIAVMVSAEFCRFQCGRGFQRDISSEFLCRDMGLGHRSIRFRDYLGTEIRT